ncbi:hypothetical protein GCM10027570_24830 [Streptomonospora sediminis]
MRTVEQFARIRWGMYGLAMWAMPAVVLWLAPDLALRGEAAKRRTRMRRTHRTWLAEDGIPEVARTARLGHRMRGMGNVCENVTPAMKEQVCTVLEERWQRSLHALKETERQWAVEKVPRLGEYYRAPGAKRAS